MKGYCLLVADKTDHSLTPLSFNSIFACIFPSNSLKDFIIQRLSIMKNGPNYQDWFRIIKTDYGVGPIFIIQGLGCSHKDLQRSQHLSIESCLKKLENSRRVQKSLLPVDLQLTHTTMWCLTTVALSPVACIRRNIFLFLYEMKGFKAFEKI